MALTLAQLNDLKHRPLQGATVSKAVAHEERLRFHTETYLEPSEIGRPLTAFFEWVKKLLPKDKYAIFLNLFSYPVGTTTLTNTIFNELEKVYESSNPSISYEFSSSDAKNDWSAFREKQKHDWRTKSWEAVKANINSVLIVDQAQEVGEEYPEPYYYFLPINDVLSFEQNADGSIKNILFNQPGKVAYFDEEHYQLARLDDNGEIVEILVEKAHGLGYTPAAFFWSDSLNARNKALKKSPISAQLADLDWLLFFQTSKKHLDLYAPYPIYSAYESECDYQNDATGDYCDGGFLRDQNQNYKLLRDGGVEQCPICSDKRLAGVGSFIEVPVPISKEDPDLRNPVQITSIDKSSLDYNVSEEVRLTAKIRMAATGLDSDTQAKESINEMQVAASFEDKTSILIGIKTNLEIAQKFVDDTMCRLRYGSVFVGSSIDYGSSFFVQSVDDLYKRYKMAKDNGASEAELAQLNAKVLRALSGSDDSDAQRLFILKHLEPYAHYTRQELMDAYSKNLLDKELVQLKLNFNEWIARFERENMNIIDFGANIAFDRKIKIINEKLISYGKERTNTEE